MYIVQTGAGRLVTCRVAELYIRVLSCHFYHIILESEAGRKDNITPRLYKFSQSSVTFCVFRCVVLIDDLIITESERFLHLLSPQIMVVCVTHIAWVRNMDETYFDLILRYPARCLCPGTAVVISSSLCGRSSAPCDQGNCHSRTQKHTDELLFHAFSSFLTLLRTF